MAKRSYLSQTDVPKYSLGEALKVARSIVDNFAGDATAPIEVAEAVGIKPTSSNFRDVTGASIAYGLTEGGYNASQISLTDIAEKILKPTEESQDLKAMVLACLKPRVLNEFYTKYNNSKFPKDSIAFNVLEKMGVPSDRTEEVLEIIKVNGEHLGFLKEIKGSTYLYIDKPILKAQDDEDEETSESDTNSINQYDGLPEDLVKKLDLNDGNESEIPSTTEIQGKPKIFITHGKNKKIVEQLKELLTFGQFEPVVSIEKETTARPVPDKVFEDMRSCQGAVIHVENENEYLDKEGKTVYVLNSNVLIEIGAAMALYGKNFILLCQNDVKLPSNLQGLYRCNYEGDGLDYEATMKLLKAFNDIRK